MSFRDDVDALAARHSSLEQELATKTREVASAAQVLEEARAKQRLPLLDNIRVATPCSTTWEKMLGGDRVRACGDCNKNVFNLSGMTRDEVEALVIETNGNMCVRYYQRTDGTILLQDCTIGVAKKRRRRLMVISAAALLAGGGLVARLMTRGSVERLDGSVHAIAGGMPMPEPPPPPPPAPPPGTTAIVGAMMPPPAPPAPPAHVHHHKGSK